MILKRLSLVIIPIIFSMLYACGSKEDSIEAEKRIEYAQILENRTPQDLMNDLYIGCDGDIESLARILQITPSSIERIRNNETIPTKDFTERLFEVSIYYTHNNQSFSKLRAALDSEYKWYNSVLHFPKHHPFAFWTINIILILLLAFIALIAIWPILAELLIFGVAWLCFAIFSPTPMEDNYINTINPVVEQIK